MEESSAEDTIPAEDAQETEPVISEPDETAPASATEPVPETEPEPSSEVVPFAETDSESSVDAIELDVVQTLTIASGEEIITTPTHPFYSPVKGWTEAAKLRAGDILVLVNGEYVVVEKVQHEILEAPVTVYNFQVEDFHTYYVSNNGVLVHNICKNDFQTKATKQESIWFDSERQARSFARTKVGHNPVNTGPGKLVSKNGVWQYRAKVGDLLDNHIHLERLNPSTGEVLINYHLRWK